jgi:hypothetical protein
MRIRFENCQLSYCNISSLYGGKTKEPVQQSRYSNRMQTGRPGFDTRDGQEIFLFSTGSWSLWGPFSLLLDGYREIGEKRPRCEAGHTSPRSIEVKNGGAKLYSPIRLHGAVLNSLSTGTCLPSTLRW